LLASGALVQPREAAVLARTNGQLEPVRAALRAQGLPITGETAAGAGVRLGTIHAAKGEEWKAVFLLGVEEGLLPHRRAIEEEQGLEQPPPVALAGELHAAYVGATRPREHLYVTHCRRRDEPEPGGGTTTRVCRPSRVLDLLPPGSLARAA
jgi:superfamily I DNA/RNA helicase